MPEADVVRAPQLPPAPSDPARTDPSPAGPGSASATGAPPAPTEPRSAAPAGTSARPTERTSTGVRPAEPTSTNARSAGATSTGSRTGSVAAGSTGVRSGHRPPLRASAGRTGPAVLAAALCAIYCAISLLKFRDLRSTGYDLGIFTEAVRSYAAIEAPVVELKGAGYHLLGDHFHPILVTLAPWYRLFPTPATLLVAQAVLFAVSAYVVSRYAVDRLGRGPGLCLGAVYGLSYGVQRAVAFDFHEIAFAVPLIAACAVALARRRWGAAACWALPLFLVKEDQALIVAGVGAYIFWRGTRWIGAALAAGAVAVGAATIFVVIPAFNAHHQYAYLHSAAPDGADPVSRLLLPGVKWWLLLSLFLITGFLALRSPLSLLVIPPLAARFWSTTPAYWQTAFHYNAVLMPLLFVAAVDGLERLAGDGWFRRWWARHGRGRHPYAVAAALAAVIAVPMTVGQPAARLLLPATWREPAHVPAARALLARIPDGAVVAADNFLAPQIVRRCPVFLFPTAYDAGGRPEWIAVRDVPGKFPWPHARYRALVDRLPGDGYTSVGHQGGIEVFRRTAGPRP